MLTTTNKKTSVMTKCKKLCTSIFSIGVLMSDMVTTVNAAYLSDAAEVTYHGSQTEWDTGANTDRVGGFPAAGGATWSIMGEGLSDASGNDPHGSASTTDIALLGSGFFTLAAIVAIIDNAMDIWASVSGFINLGQVADGNVGFGATEANGGHLGDIRIGAIFMDGQSNVLAHAFQPGTASIFGSTGTIAGDMHIDNSENWGDGTNGTLDLHTVILHELGQIGRASCRDRVLIVV